MPVRREAGLTVAVHRRVRRDWTRGLVAGACLLLRAVASAQTPVTLIPTLSAARMPAATTVSEGEPVTAGVELLPASATGTVTFSLDGGVATQAAVAPAAVGRLIALGDAATYAGTLADRSLTWPALVAAGAGLTPVNLAAPGTGVCDVLPREAAARGLGAGGAAEMTALLTGTEDVLGFGAGAHLAVFAQCHQALLAWLGTPVEDKVLPGGAGLAGDAGWTQTPAFGGCCLQAMTSASAGAVLTANVTVRGGALYVWTRLDAQNAGVLSVQVDGGAATVVQMQPAASLGLAPQSVGLLRMPVSAGMHGVTMTVVSGIVGVLGVGGAPAEDDARPALLAGDVPALAGTVWADALAAYTQQVLADCVLLHGDGLDVRATRTQQTMTAVTAQMIDTTELTPAGEAAVAQAFTAVTQPLPTAGNVATAQTTFAALAAGSHTIHVAYSGDATHTAAQADVAVTVYAAGSVTGLSGPGSVTGSQTPVTLTSGVSGTGYSASPTGLVTLLDVTAEGAVAVQQGYLAGGDAALTATGLAVGHHTLQAVYAGDVAYAGSSSAVMGLDVLAPAATTVSLTAPGTHFATGAAIDFTIATVPATATGAMQLMEGNAVLGQATLISGTATVTLSTLTPGLHALTAAYAGDAQDAAAVSPVLTIEVETQEPDVLLAASSASLPYGSSLTLTAALAPATATGSVRLMDNGALLAAVPLISGAAAWSTSALAVGTHSITAIYSGDATDLAAVSQAVSVTVTPVATALTLAVAPVSVVTGGSVTMTASGLHADATGSITFADAGATLATSPAVAGGALATAVLTAPGAHSLTAAYGGDASHAASVAPAVLVEVTRQVSTTLLSVSATPVAGGPGNLVASVTPLSATGTVVFRDAMLGVLGEAVLTHGSATLTLPAWLPGSYSLSANYGGDALTAPSSSGSVALTVAAIATSTTIVTPTAVIAGSSATFAAHVLPVDATGEVTFFDGISVLGAGALGGGAATLSAALSGGTHSLHAAYAGDTLHAGSASAVATVIVTPAPTVTSISLAQTTVSAGEALVANVRVTTAATLSPTGVVTLRSGSTILATGTLNGSLAGAGYVTLTASTAALGLGTSPLVASYSGDASDAASDSGTASVSVTVVPMPVMLSLGLSAAQVPPQTAVTLTAEASAAITPTGRVVFTLDGQTLTSAALDANGRAAAVFMPPGVGSYAIAATYVPAGTFAQAAAQAQILTVTPPVALAFSGASPAVSAGGSATAMLTVTPLSGFTGALASTCSATAVWVTCTAAQMPATIGAASAFDTPVQIVVAASTVGLPHASLVLPAGGTVLAVLCCLPDLRRRRRVLLGVAGLCAALGLSACGEGGTFFDVPAGVQRITVTVTALGVASSASLTVNVQ